MANLQKKDHTMLLTGLINNRFDQFWSVNQRLMSTEPIGDTPKSPTKNAPFASSSSASQTKGGFRSIPIRVYLPDKNPQTFIQKLVKPFNSECASVTLLDFLTQHNFFTASSLSSPSSHDNISSLRDVEDHDTKKRLQFPSNIRIVTHGMEVPLETPLQWMSQHLSYPDNFIHLCIFSTKTR
jgi:autophagy-related protein 5